MLLEVAHIDVSYAGAPALHDVSLSVDRGSCVGLVGASGSGKSTLAKSIVGLLGPNGSIDAGSVTFDGQELVGIPAAEMRRLRGARIGYIFQNPGDSFSPIRRIGVQYHEAMAEHGHVDQVADDKLLLATFTRLGLDDGERIMHSYPFELSGGMAQRTAIAFACALRPDLIVADEPTSALDVTYQAQVVAEILSLVEDYGTSVLLVSHNIAMVAYACDRMAVMHNGRIVEAGPASSVFDAPEDPYTKELIAAVPTLDVKEGAR